MTDRERIRRAVAEVKLLSRRVAGSKRPWDKCLEAVEYVTHLEVHTRYVPEEELKPYLDLILVKRNYLRYAVRKKKARRRGAGR